MRGATATRGLGAVTVILLGVGLVAASVRDGNDPSPRANPEAAPTSSRPSATAVPVPARNTTTTEGTSGGVVEIRYRVERHTSDAETSDFELTLDATLHDPRGWMRAGFRFVRADDAPYVVVLAEGPEVDRRCLPYETAGQFSCQNGPVVALNADRWRRAHPKWTGSLHEYRQMLVNHEVGHLLGQRHPDPQCPSPGRPAPVMAQQTTELGGCLPNPWPLEHEIAAASRHDQPLAPAFGE